ncbi:hypothetical protein K1T71_010711 [Dendrolimus kikuchii]|uniref:Uncharacterized protein n=1 Tax=Dendrolimus kikuchii TaxID=765133 RepID=A0ACC1CQ17_9NEOP|nr:hypothetical protein K1T71_010711 [Dendrolimus kikuchii]
MSSLNMCVKLALCFLLVAVVESHVIKQHQYPLPPDGIIMEITLKNKANKSPISTVKIDIDEFAKKVVVSNLQHDVEKPPKKPVKPDFVPTIENRHGIRVGTCPSGYVQKGGFCFPDDDY